MARDIGNKMKRAAVWAKEKAAKSKEKTKKKEERAKKRLVEPVHTKIIYEDGKFYVEDAGSNFGTYFGLGRKSWFEVHAGDCIMLAGCRCNVVRRGTVFRPLQGFIDMVSRIPARRGHARTPAEL